MDIETKKINGIISVVNTPFTHDNRIDIDSLKRHVKYQLKCGVSGFLVTALAAEVYKLTFDERQLIVQTIIDEVNGRVPVIGGTAAENHVERIEYVKTYTNIGCDIILSIIPYEDERSYQKLVYEIIDQTDKPLMIQDWDFSGYGIPIPLIVKMFNDIEQFKYLKVEVVPAGMKYTQVIQATDGKLHVSGGWAGNQMIEALDRGVHSFMPTIFLDIYVKIYELHHSGNREEAIKLFNQFLPVLAFSHQHLDISVHFNKIVSYKQGLFSTPNVREPIIPFDEYHRKISEELIEYGIDLTDKY